MIPFLSLYEKVLNFLIFDKAHVIESPKLLRRAKADQKE
jgi:hypothetical protein